MSGDNPVEWPRRDEPDSGRTALRIDGIGPISGFDRKKRIVRAERLDGSSRKRASGMR
jgi:hypothetical protein